MYTKLKILDRIYDLYNNYTATVNIVCKKQCADCCTDNVTMTTIEGYKILKFLESENLYDYFEIISTNSGKNRYRPKITTNRLAELCMQGKEVPQDEIGEIWGTCPLLKDNECLIYPVRPFGCRCFVSETICSEEGQAQVDPFTLSVNNVFLQYIEHIDQRGFTGNFADIMLFLESGQNLKSYINGFSQPTEEIVPNYPLKVLPVPPEDQSRIQPMVKALHKICTS
ncbi:MAG: hypothetical protein HN931_02215 [Desulfobacterales bacterium]|nr:hypothetical protein [Desulfobacteraceae bacterium]MBT7084970.1 hypothetical protein [Desulfobacterales bacterium]